MPASYRDIVVIAKIADLGVLISQNPIQIEPSLTLTYQYTSRSISSFNIRFFPLINKDIKIDNSPFLLTISIFDSNLNISSLNKIFSLDLLNTITNTTTRPSRNIYYLPK
jgi:hypothetical protein